MKTRKPYFTTYPKAAWYWFDTAVYGTHTPKTGNLPSKLFALLKGGTDGGSSRWYKSEAEAMDDYKQAWDAWKRGLQNAGSSL